MKEWSNSEHDVVKMLSIQNTKIQNHNIQRPDDQASTRQNFKHITMRITASHTVLLSLHEPETQQNTNTNNNTNTPDNVCSVVSIVIVRVMNAE